MPLINMNIVGVGSNFNANSSAVNLLDGTHARLVKVNDRFDFKTLSCSMLDGKHDYSLTNR